MAFKAGDKVLANGQPGQVMLVDDTYSPALNLVLFEQPVVRYFQDGALTPANPPATTQPATTTTAPSS